MQEKPDESAKELLKHTIKSFPKVTLLMVQFL